jgi:CRISPR-associated protein Csd1
MLLTSLARFCLEHHIQDGSGDDRYREAMRALAAATGEHRVDIGGLEILFWSDSREGDVFLSGALGAVADCWRYRNSPAVRAWLDRLEAGDPTLGPQASGAFHVLGLARSDASPVIEFWITDTFDGLADRVRAFWDDLRFAPGSQLSSAAILQLVQEAAFTQDFQRIAPRLTQDLLSAMLSGSDFPPRLMQVVMDRILKDGDLNGGRAAVLKALLSRRARLARNRVVRAQLDAEAVDAAYLLGRLFAVFDALWALDQATSRPSVRFLRWVAVAPGLTTRGVSALSRLKLMGARRRNRPRAQALARDIDGLATLLQSRLPANLSLENQARLVLGLYQQRQALIVRWPGHASPHFHA